MTSQSKTIPVIDPFEADTKKDEKTKTMGISHIPVEGIKSNLEKVLVDFKEIFDGAKDQLGGTSIAHVDLSLGLAIDGSVGIFGSKAGASAKGGITVRLLFK